MRLATRAIRVFFAAFALLLVGMASPAIASPAAAARAVTIQNFAFAPPTVTVSVGDTITWTNQDPTQHSARATGGSFDTGALSQGSAKTITFTVAGTFTYVCAFHPSSMSGTVVVAAPTPPPTVAPTPVPTVRSAQPTPTPTVAPTAQATVATTAPATTAPVAVASPATTASATPSDAGGPGPLIIGGAVAIVVGLGALAWVLLRR